MKLSVVRHEKGWGFEDWIFNSVLYCGKVLSVNKGKRCSLHYHQIKTETMLVVEGLVKMEFRSLNQPRLESLTLRPGEVFHIEPGLVHRFTALERSVIHEFSTQHFEEDSIRIEKGD